MSYYGKKVGTVQPLLFGGYESGPRIPREFSIYFFGDDCFGCSSRRRRKQFGFFRSRLLSVVKPVEVEAEWREEGLNRRRSFAERREQPQASLAKLALAAPKRGESLRPSNEMKQDWLDHRST